MEFTNYGRFDLFRFLIPVQFFRRRAIQEVLNQIRIAKETSGAEDISIIAHSFGTYVVTRTLERFAEVSFDRVILCGSIVRQNYPWTEIICRARQVHSAVVKHSAFASLHKSAVA